MKPTSKSRITNNVIKRGHPTSKTAGTITSSTNISKSKSIPSHINLFLPFQINQLQHFFRFYHLNTQRRQETALIFLCTTPVNLANNKSCTTHGTHLCIQGKCDPQVRFTQLLPLLTYLIPLLTYFIYIPVDIFFFLILTPKHLIY